jgi:hypothetical protein
VQEGDMHNILDAVTQKRGPYPIVVMDWLVLINTGRYPRSNMGATTSKAQVKGFQNEARAGQTFWRSNG